MNLNKLDMESKDIINENVEKIGNLFPNVIVESEKGKSIDFELLKQELSKEIVEGNKEKYQLTWPGKKEAIVNANTPCNKTLRPVKERSIDFENTQNIYIEGDNLDALKILQESYLNKIKCIYIDPPYNTGNDFIYNDKFINKNELNESGQIDEYNNRLITNTESNGKYHSDWLSMMYSRLKLARNLLTDDGLIFISIDDNELINLKKICDEIFGEANYLNLITVETGAVFGTKVAHVNKRFVKVKDYILIYKKNECNIVPLYQPLKDIYDIHYRTMLDNSNNKCSLIEYFKTRKDIVSLFSQYNLELRIDNIEKLMSLDDIFYKIMTEELATNIFTTHPMTVKIPEEVKQKLNSENAIEYNGKMITMTSSGTISTLDSFADCLKYEENGKKIRSSYRGDLWKNFQLDMQNSDTEGGVFFNNGKKPLRLISDIISCITDEDDIILDFFSGSATTGQATMFLNSIDYKARKFILVQIPEKLNIEDYSNKKIQKSYDFSNICELGEQRLRNCSELYSNIDCGFRVYRIDSSNMKDIYYSPNELKQSQLGIFESNIKEDRTAEDLLTQVILDLGLTLDLKIEEKNILDNKVFFVDENSLIACFDNEININVVDEICKYSPLKVVFKDESFKMDNDKINLQERFKKLSPNTEISIL